MYGLDRASRQLKMLLAHGTTPRGTNTLRKAMDFEDIETGRMLLQAGALPDELDGTHVGGERPWVVLALNREARRLCSPDMVRLLLEAGADHGGGLSVVQFNAPPSAQPNAGIETS